MSRNKIPHQAIADYVQAREKVLELERQHPHIYQACGYSESISEVIAAAEAILRGKKE
jgi:hypothetical protein